MDMSDKYTKDESEYITDAKIVALLKVLQKSHPHIFEEYQYQLDKELTQRGYSPDETTLGYREQQS